MNREKSYFQLSPDERQDAQANQLASKNIRDIIRQLVAKGMFSKVLDDETLWEEAFENGSFVTKTVIRGRIERDGYQLGDLIPVWNEEFVPDLTTLERFEEYEKDGWTLVLAGSAYDEKMGPKTVSMLEQIFGKKNVQILLYNATTLKDAKPTPFAMIFLKKSPKSEKEQNVAPG